MMGKDKNAAQGHLAAGNGCRYQAIANDLCSRIARGEWLVGGKIPGRQALAREYNVDLNTIQPAVARLLAIGLLRAVDRSGTFVSRAVHPADYFDAANAQNVQPISAVGTDVSLPPVLHAPPPVAGIFLMGGYTPDESMEETDKWGAIAALAIERTFSQQGGRVHSLYIRPWFQLDECVEVFRQKGVNALIVVDTFGILVERFNDNPMLQFLEACNLPVIIVGFDATLSTLSFVSYDQRYAGYLAAEHLIHCGYQEMMFVMPLQAPWAQERLKGAMLALKHYHRSSDTFCVYPEHSTIDDIAFFYSLLEPHQVSTPASLVEYFGLTDGIRAYLSAGTHRAVIAANDEIAISILTAMQEHGLTAGIDYGLIGFDNHREARQYGLTTVRPPVEAISETAAHLALSMLQRSAHRQSILLRSDLIVRSSTNAVGAGTNGSR